MGLSDEYVQQFNRVEEALATSGSSQEQLIATLNSLVPGFVDAIKDGKGDSKRAAERQMLYNGMRAACLHLTQKANAGQQPPMQYKPPGSPHPPLQQLLNKAVYLSTEGFLETSIVITLLEDLMDNCSVSHCPDLFAWLEEHTHLFRPSSDPSGQHGRGKGGNPFDTQINKNNLLRLCNTLLKRLSKSADALLSARVLIFMANFFPLLTERSGLNIPGTVNVWYPAAKPEAVEPGAVDSQGYPVDVKLYTTFWNLQEPLHDFKRLLRPDNKEGWPRFRADVQLVLKALAGIEVTVPAGSPGAQGPTAAAADGGSTPGLPSRGSGGGAGGDVEMEESAGDLGGGSSSSAAPGQGQEMTVGYLSSHKLFGLQLRDGAFRRNFLVQVLIMLQSLTVLGKAQETVLKGTHATEAQELERQVYEALEATPADGADFAKMVRNVLQRDAHWVQWKRGQRAAGGGGREESCVNFSLPPAKPLEETIAAAEAAAAKKRSRESEVLEKVLAARKAVAAAALEYDEDEDFGLNKRKKMEVTLPRNSDIIASVADTWVHTIPANNMAGLRVDERPGYPSLERLGARALADMDPDSAIDRDYRRLYADRVYHWKVARMLSLRVGEVSNKTKKGHDGSKDKDRDSYLDPANVEQQLIKQLPGQVPEALREQMAAEAAARADAAKADAAAGSAAGNRSGATPPPEGAAAAAVGGGEGELKADGDGDGGAGE